MPSATESLQSVNSSLYKNEMALVKVCLEIEARGVLIDRNYSHRGLQCENKQVEIAKAAFKSDTGLEYVDSNKLFFGLFKERGEKIATTAKGNPSFTYDILEAMDSPTAKLINKVRYHEKRAGTYWSSFLHYADERGIIHPNMQPAGTTTGRFSYSNPNLQNIPKEDQEEDRATEYVVRGAFIPPSNQVIISLDYSQLEYRLMVAYANETRVIDMINQGWDSHEAIAQIVGLPRSLAKTVNFAILYGAGNEKLGKMIGKTKQEAADIRALYFSRLPRVKNLIKDITMTAEHRGFVKNWMGRKFWLSNYDYAYAMPNHLIQGSGADVCKRAMVEIHKANLPIDMAIQVHDELVFYGLEERLDSIPKAVKIMEDVFPAMNGMRLVVNVKSSKKSWAARDLDGLGKLDSAGK